MIELQQVLNVMVAIGLPSIVLFYIRDRRKNNAQTKVLEGTVEAQIDLSSISAVEAHVALVERAYLAENASLRRRLEDAESEAASAREEADRLRTKLEQVQAELETLRTRVEELQQQINGLLTESLPGE